MTDCIFCKIVNKEAPSTIIEESANVVAFININPVAEIHILITPKVHIVSFMEFKDKDLSLEMIQLAQKIIKSKKIESGFKLIFNGGKYQAIPHLHWHLLGGKIHDISET